MTDSPTGEACLSRLYSTIFWMRAGERGGLDRGERVRGEGAEVVRGPRSMVHRMLERWKVGKNEQTEWLPIPRSRTRASSPESTLHRHSLHLIYPSPHCLRPLPASQTMMGRNSITAIQHHREQERGSIAPWPHYSTIPSILRFRIVFLITPD